MRPGSFIHFYHLFFFSYVISFLFPNLTFFLVYILILCYVFTKKKILILCGGSDKRKDRQYYRSDLSISETCSSTMEAVALVPCIRNVQICNVHGDIPKQQHERVSFRQTKYPFILPKNIIKVSMLFLCVNKKLI